MWAILTWTCAAAISVLALKYFSIPYLWIFLTCATALLVTASMDRARRALWFNVACITVGLALFEYYFWTSGLQGYIAGRVEEGNALERIPAPHGELGWAPQAGTVARHRLSFEGELLFDAAYTIGPNGLRMSSPFADDQDSISECLLFFGDSFTFGQGLEDHQTLPFRVNARTGDRYRAYNFGVMGYGAHQMLSALQHGFVQDTVQCDRAEVSHIFYQAISDHVRRSAGRDKTGAGRDKRGPQYVLTQDGELKLDGHSVNNGNHAQSRPLTQLLGNQIFKSMIYRKIIEGKYVHGYSREAINLYVGIVERVQQLVHSYYPSAEFHVILWDEDDVDSRVLTDELKRKGIEVHLISDILPNYEPGDPNEIYRLHERDSHPNALANELIAQYVVGQILPQPGSPAVE